MNEELKVIISAEITKFKQGVQDAKKQMSDFTKDSEKGASKMDDAFKKAGEGIKSAYATVGKAIAATGAALLGTSALTEEYRENMAKLSTAFETAGASAETAKDVYNDLYRVMGESDTATEAANHLAKLTTNQKELSEWTNICQGIYATFGDSIPIEGLTEAANETAKVGQVTGTLADALNWAGISEDAFNEKLAKCNTEAEREKLIRETLSGVYDEAASKYEETASGVLAQNEAQAKLTETLAQVGEAVQPVLTAFTNFAHEALAEIVPHVKELADKGMPKLNKVLGVAADVIGEVMGFLADNWQIVVGIAGVIAGITAAIGLYNTVAAVKAAMAAMEVTTVWALVSAYAAQAAAMIVAIAPYVAIVAAIAAVIAIIVTCIKHWDEIKAKVKEVWGNIKQHTTDAVNNVKNKFNEMKSNAIEKVNSMKSNIVNKFNEIKDGIADKINSARDKVKTAIDKIKSFFNFKWELPKLKMPTISISGKFSLSPLSVPKFSIKWNEFGGVFKKPTVLPWGNTLQGLGENGAEAIVPLEKNTQWLDKIADRLASKQGNVPIVLQVDGKTFAQTSIDSINQLTRQQGRLGLNLA